MGTAPSTSGGEVSFTTRSTTPRSWYAEERSMRPTSSRSARQTRSFLAPHIRHAATTPAPLDRGRPVRPLCVSATATSSGLITLATICSTAWATSPSTTPPSCSCSVIWTAAERCTFPVVICRMGRLRRQREPRHGTDRPLHARACGRRKDPHRPQRSMRSRPLPQAPVPAIGDAPKERRCADLGLGRPIGGRFSLDSQEKDRQKFRSASIQRACVTAPEASVVLSVPGSGAGWLGVRWNSTTKVTGPSSSR